MNKQQLTIWLSLTLLAFLMTCGVCYVNSLDDGSVPSLRKSPQSISCCDSLNNYIMELKIENGRNEIIIERLREHDSLAVIEATKNLE